MIKMIIILKIIIIFEQLNHMIYMMIKNITFLNLIFMRTKIKLWKDNFKVEKINNGSSSSSSSSIRNVVGVVKIRIT